MEEFLGSTELCDCGNERLKEKAQELTKGVKTPKEAAIRIFRFVRDEISWAADFLDAKASDTLKRGGGLSVNKTNLQVALLRVAGIPARYHHTEVNKKALNGLILNVVYKSLPDTVVHCWCECYLSQRWLSCESILDEALYQAVIEKGLYTREQVPTIDWDGENDLIVMTKFLGEDFGTSPSMDDALKKAQRELLPPKPITRVICLLSNTFVTNKLRGKKKK